MLKEILRWYQRMLEDKQRKLEDKQRKERAEASDGKLPTEAQKELLCTTMLYRAFVHIRVLGWQGDAKKAAAIADAFHNLPFYMHRPDFEWSALLLFINCYYRDYPEDRGLYPDYLAMFDEILSIESSDG